jgi:NADH:ubiquinone oxidoreductase subunit 6 (subunit J)
VTRKVIAAICYLVGAVAVLYVGVILPYFYPEHTQETLALRYWPVILIGFVLAVVAALVWPGQQRNGDET